VFHSEALKSLIPARLDGQFEADLFVEGRALDSIDEASEALLAELSPAAAYETLATWERVYGLAPALDDPLQLRRNRIVQKMRDLGRLDLAYFVGLGLALGFTIVIDELRPFMAGWGEAGDELGDDDSDWCWRVWYRESDNGYYFRAGESEAGEYLSYGYFEVLQDLFNDLKPADTFIEFLEF